MTESPRSRFRLPHWGWFLLATGLTVYGLILGPVACFAARCWWGFDLANHFRSQYFWWLTASTISLAGCGLWELAAASGLLLIVHTTSLWPFYTPRTVGPCNERRLRVVSANVCSRNDQFERVLDFVRREAPDVAVFLEVNQAWGTALAALGDAWPFSHTRAQPGSRGIAIYSRVPFESIRVKFLKHGVPTIVAQLCLHGTPVTIICAHPYPPVSRTMAAVRDLQCLELAELLAGIPAATLLIGDLNMTSWSPAFADLISQTDLRDSRLGFGIQPSWPSFLPSVLRIPIDHFLVSPAIEVANRRIGPHIGSDHLPIIVDLAVRTNLPPCGR